MVVADHQKSAIFTIISWSLFTLLSTPANASPIASHPLAPPPLFPRDVSFRNISGKLTPFDTTTSLFIPQALASDGGGSGFNVPASLWIVFCFAVGVPSAVAGIRGWRLTIGLGIGLAMALCSWTAFISSMSATPIPDLVLTIIVLLFFIFGLVGGIFDFCRLIGLGLLAVIGGLAFGMRIVLLKDNLLVDGQTSLAGDWAIIALIGLASGFAIVKWQRASITFSTASVGSFLMVLGIDLIINKQNGMSRGLRFLFDRNNAHLTDILTTGYKPPLSTQILIGISLGLTPVFAYVQHLVFKQPFSRKDIDDSSDSIRTRLSGELSREGDGEGQRFQGGELIPPRSPGAVSGRKRQTFLSIWDGMWDTRKAKGANRFSL